MQGKHVMYTTVILVWQRDGPSTPFLAYSASWLLSLYIFIPSCNAHLLASQIFSLYTKVYLLKLPLAECTTNYRFSFAQVKWNRPGLGLFSNERKRWTSSTPSVCVSANPSHLHLKILEESRSAALRARVPQGLLTPGNCFVSENKPMRNTHCSDKEVPAHVLHLRKLLYNL